MSDGPVTDELTAILRRLEQLQSMVYALEEERDSLNANLEAANYRISELSKEVHQGRIEIAKLVDERRKLSAQLATEKANHRETIKQRDVSNAESSKYATTFLRIADLMGRWDGRNFILSSNQAAGTLRKAINDAGSPAAIEPPAEAAPARPDVATLRAVREAVLAAGNGIMRDGDKPWYRLVDLLDEAITKTEAAEQS